MNSDSLDPTNPVVALCAQGMELEGTPAEAERLFALAWATRRDDFDAAIAAHFVARHQRTMAETLRWNALAVEHAAAVADGRATGLMASLYLNLGDAQANVGEVEAAAAAARRAMDHLAAVAPGGYREWVAMAIRRLAARVGATDAGALPDVDRVLTSSPPRTSNET